MLRRSEKMPHDLRLWGASPEPVYCFDRFDVNLYFNTGNDFKAIIYYDLRQSDGLLLYHATVRDITVENTNKRGVYTVATNRFHLPQTLPQVFELHAFWFTFMASRNYIVTYTEFNQYYIAFGKPNLDSYWLNENEEETYAYSFRESTILYRLGGRNA